MVTDNLFEKVFRLYFIIPLLQRRLGYTVLALFVHPYLRLSFFLSIQNSLRNGCMDFSENLYTYYSPNEDVHLEFSY